MKRSDIRNFFKALQEGKGFGRIYEAKQGLYCGSCNMMANEGSKYCEGCGCSENDMKIVEYEDTPEGRKVIEIPDFSGDGKITKKDVLMGRGVIPKPGEEK